MRGDHSSPGERARPRGPLLPLASVLTVIAIVAAWPRASPPPARQCVPCKERAELLPALEALSASATAVYRTLQSLESTSEWRSDDVELIEMLCFNPEAAAARWPGLSPNEHAHTACWAVHSAGIYLSRVQVGPAEIRARLTACIAASLENPVPARRYAAVRAVTAARAVGQDDFREPLRRLASDGDPRVAKLAASAISEGQTEAPR